MSDGDLCSVRKDPQNRRAATSRTVSRAAVTGLASRCENRDEKEDKDEDEDDWGADRERSNHGKAMPAVTAPANTMARTSKDHNGDARERDVATAWVLALALALALGLALAWASEATPGAGLRFEHEADAVGAAILRMLRSGSGR
ncbi:hypothetical protein SPI_01279 [Niveomyces insectorum RCEF 264]|uniref:Uncharacterized protein n=1 Tax=Niveomyces insectorum RCEF 264 TaxID=1081102 RepID=A0A167YUD6_9HYPO|nr:hypothetical protein SPI_01279 [Niveomyces insectorum RCEF 264]